MQRIISEIFFTFAIAAFPCFIYNEEKKSLEGRLRNRFILGHPLYIEDINWIFRTKSMWISELVGATNKHSSKEDIENVRKRFNSSLKYLVNCNSYNKTIQILDEFEREMSRPNSGFDEENLQPIINSYRESFIQDY